MKDYRNEKYVMLTILIGFTAACGIQMLSAILYPPDFSGAYPIYLDNGVIIIQLSGAFLLIGLTVIGMKAEEEKQILAAAGFTAQAISFGVSMVSLYEITNDVSFQDYERFYQLSVSSNFLLFPSLLLIATYDRFKKWIRISGLVACFPLFVSTCMFLFGIRDYHLLEKVSNLGYLFINITWVLWGLNIYSNYRGMKPTQDS